MKKQIVRISILQSSKIVTLLYTLLGLLYTLIGIPMIIIGIMKDQTQLEIIGGIYLFGLVFMGGLGFIFFVIAAAIYNRAATMVGGFEFEVRDVA